MTKKEFIQKAVLARLTAFPTSCELLDVTVERFIEQAEKVADSLENVWDFDREAP